LTWNEPVFKRPKDLRVVDMCIYVDNMFEDFVKNPTQEKEDILTKYIYWIVDSLAKKQNLFGNNYQYYDEFALFTTSEIFCLMRKKLEHSGEVIRGREVQPIKSILNFVKTVLYPYKVQFEQQMYSFVVGSKLLNDTEALADNLRDEVRQQYLKDLGKELSDLMEDLPNRIKSYFYKICPYKTDPVMMQKIYLSVVLTLIENVTLRNKVNNRINTRDYRKDVKKLLDMYYKNTSRVVMWHLPKHMENYIRYLTTQVKHLIGDVIRSRKGCHEMSDEAINEVIKTGFTTYDQDQEEL